MKFWLDTEFCEDGRTIDLISIGVVSEDGREFYRQNAGADLNKANAWVKENVLPRLLSCPKGLVQVAHRGAKCGHPECPWRPNYLIGRELYEFVNGVSWTSGSPLRPNDPEFWGYYADYDWVAVCQLFGRMVDLPPGWPMYCRDLKQWCDDLGNPKLPDEGKDEHNALADARWNNRAYNHLTHLQGQRYKEMHDAWTRIHEEESARTVSKKPGNVRGPQARRKNKVGSGSDLQRATQ